MSALDLNQALSQFSSQQTIVNSLWAFYAVTCYGAGSFNLPRQEPQRTRVAAAVSVGFMAFTVGHAVLVMNSLALMTSLKDAMMAMKGADASIRYLGGSLDMTAVPPHNILFAHVVIDLAVITAIWVKVFVKSKPSTTPR